MDAGTDPAALPAPVMRIHNLDPESGAKKYIYIIFTGAGTFNLNVCIKFIILNAKFIILKITNSSVLSTKFNLLPGFLRRLAAFAAPLTRIATAAFRLPFLHL